MKSDRILWADDEIDLLRPYIIFLEEKGYEVVTTTNGKDAVDLCQQENFDIVFLDENMPGLSGLETLSEIKNTNPATPIVMITKSEEENIMNMAIGNKIADYLIKPVNPNQILMTLKKHIHKKEIINEHTTSTYRQEYQDLNFVIDKATTLNEFIGIHKTLVFWELELQESDKSMRDLLNSQKADANKAFSRFIRNNYEKWFEQADQRPLLSPDIFKRKVFPILDNDEKVFFILIDNFRYDQWKIVQTLLTDFYTVTDDSMYCSILPTATQYARNAIFSGLMPLQIQQMYPNLWLDESEEAGKNQMEDQLIQTQIDRFRKHYTFSYNKVNESDYCEKLIRRLPELRQKQLNVIVLNFIDMMSHSRTESKMMRELANDEPAYLSLTKSWFKHSSTHDLFRKIAKMGYKVVVTTDHGTVKITDPVKVVGDKNTNVNLRYKVGKSLNYNAKKVYEVTDPKKIGLPSPSICHAYIFATQNDFFAYPNNYNYYVSYYKNTLQHGDISMEEMLVPLVTLAPK